MKIAVLDDYQKLAHTFAPWGDLNGRADVTFFHDTLQDEDALVDRMGSFDAICLMRERTPFGPSLLSRLPKLRLLTTTGMHNASIDLDAAKALGVTVCGTRSIGHSTAELAFAFILNLARGMRAETTALDNGNWQVGVGRDLYGARLGLIGLGRLGGLMAGYGRAFGMDVVAWSTNLTDEAAAQGGARRVSKDELFATSEFISIHTRLSARNEGLVRRVELRQMRPDAFLINTSRAQIVDQAALIEALEGRHIAGAALDVYDIEPLPSDHPLRGVPNLLLTPHIGYVTRETYRVFYSETLDAVEAFLNGAPIRVIA